MITNNSRTNKNKTISILLHIKRNKVFMTLSSIFFFYFLISTNNNTKISVDFKFKYDMITYVRFFENKI